MPRKMPFRLAMFVVAMTTSATAVKPAAAAPGPELFDITWSALAGLGYDSNAFQAPNATYVDYGALPIGSNPTVIPKRKSGFFVPFELKADAAQSQDQDTRLLGQATADGSLYQGSASNANEYNMRLRGGYEQVLGRKDKSENTLYIGGLIGKHKQIYVDHDSGLGKTTTLSGSDISTRYSYTNFGFEAEYDHRVGNIDYGVRGKYLLYDYHDPVAVSELDHDYFRVVFDATIPVAQRSKLNLSFGHSIRDYSNRHSRNAQGRILNANPLAVFTYNAVGATWSSRISSEWLLFLDLDHTQRADGYVSYDDYKENRFGGRLLYEQDSIKARLAIHHWIRDYPNGFAFDVAGLGVKNYSGNDLKFKAELAQTKNTALWTELVYEAQSATDLRYDYIRAQVMGGMSWAY